MTIPVPNPESLRGTITGGAIAGIVVGTTAARGQDQNKFHHNGLNQAVLDDVAPFLGGDDSALVRLPPAVSSGAPVDPIGHIVCVIKTKTKSNQSNDRSSAHTVESLTTNFVDEVSAQNVRILLQGGDGKGETVVTPISMGAQKLTKADSGRALDAFANGNKIRSWVKDAYDHRTAAFDPSLTNVLQFDVSTAEAERMTFKFQSGQSMRIKVKFPWLCDEDCSMTEPIDKNWIEKISPTMSRVSIMLKPEACHLLPTMNK
jgi:hypothetical protein